MTKACESIRFLPETLRALVGDGSVPPRAIYRPIVPLVGRINPLAPRPPKPASAFKNPLRLLLNPDIALLLFSNGVVCAVYYGITASISTLFAETYPFLTEATIGLCFLPIGGGMVLGSSFTGKLLDKEFQRMKAQMMNVAEGDDKVRSQVEDEEDLRFPIEKVNSRLRLEDRHLPVSGPKARLRLMPFCLVIFVGSCVGYGWCLENRANIAGPLVLQISSQSFN